MNDFKFAELQKKVSSFLQFDFPENLKWKLYSGVYVAKDKENITIGGSEITDFYRGFMLLYLELLKNENTFEIKEKRHFKTLGFSIDLSRNGVIKVEQVKRILDCMALLGFNVLKMYMEDVYDLPGFAHFGYRRGKYSHRELKEIDDYANNMGIEVIPSIQTLGHMEQYLRYRETVSFRENEKVLLCGTPETYELIEEMVKTMRNCFRTKRIVVNCDEAGGVGVKQILNDKRYINPYDVVIKHLNKVEEICNKYEFTTIVHGDLFYGHLGKGYYDFEFSKPDKKILDNIPAIDIILWDYYHTEYDDYKTLLTGHRSLDKKVIFMGGIWTWSGQLPDMEFTLNSMMPALECCLDNNVEEVWAATFGDDGNETNIAFALPQLFIFSEYCFRGRKCNKTHIETMIKSLFKISPKLLLAFSGYHYPFISNLEKKEYIHPVQMGKKILYTHLLYNMTGTYDFSDILPRHEKALAELKSPKCAGKWESYLCYAECIFKITINKMKCIPMIKKAYYEKDVESLVCIIDNAIPELISLYEELQKLHERQWMNMYKPFGWEELNGRYGATISNLNYVQRTLGKYIMGEIANIPELEFEYIEEKDGCYHYGGMSRWKDLKSTGI